jgi:DNA-binding beta-propeller fold protein YncE
MTLSARMFITITACVGMVVALSPPACQFVAPLQETLDVQTAFLTLQNNPFGLAYASNDIGFVGITSGFTLLNTSTFPPTRIYSLATPFGKLNYGVEGLAITRNKRTVYLSSGPGAIAIDVEKAVAGGEGSIVDYLNGTVGQTSIETTLSLHDHYAFVSQEDGSAATGLNGAIEVFQVHRTNKGSVSNTYIGYIELGYLVVGTALSPDGRRLYATSENATREATSGTLSVLDVATLKTNPGQALLVTVDAGCAPVRVAVSHDGKHVWVTDREGNQLLAYDAAKLESNYSDALVASVQVGTSPVGLIFVNEGRHIITADSNRFGYNATTGLTVVDVKAALEGKQGFPRIATGLFPRELALSPDGKTLLVSDYDSKMVQAVNVSQIV